MRRILITVFLAGCTMAYGETGPPQPQASSSACRSWQWVNPRPESQMLESVVAGDPGVVAVGDDGSILFSPEGISWTAVESGTTAYLNDVVWTGEAFFAVGDGGAVVTSADGVSWVPLATDTTLDLLRLAFGAGVLVAVGPETNLLTSNDGASWVVTELGWWAQTDDVVWAGTQFIVVGPSLSAISNDGWQWQTEYEFDHDSSSCNIPMRLTSTESEAVALYPCHGEIYSSTDGLNWTWVFEPGSDDPVLMNIAWFDGMFIGLGVYENVWIATDPSSWMRARSPLKEGFNSVAWTGQRFIAVGWSSGIMTSRTGADWTVVQVADGALGSINGLAAGNGVLVGDASGDVLVSSDGFDWSVVPSVGGFRDVTFGNGRFVAVTRSQSGVSLDGMSWSRYDTGTTSLRAVEWVGDRFLAVEHFRGLIVGSSDGQVWSVEYPETAFTRWYGLGAGPGGAVAVGIDDENSTAAVLIEQSPGIWEKRLPFLGTGLKGTLRDITFGAGRWVAVGGYGKVVASNDLATWQVVNLGFEDTIFSVSWNGSEFLAAGSDGIVISSPDGLVWIRETTPTNAYLESVEWFDDAWYVAGSGGAVLRGGCTWPPDPPVAAFSFEPANPAPGEVIRFDDTTSGYVTSWLWQFGDGSSTATNPTHVYSSAGTYDVVQTVCNYAACDQATIQVNVTERPPQAVFGWRYPVLLSDGPATWLDLSSGPPSSWMWVFGDGSVSSERDPVQAYDEPGIYTTRLEVNNGSGRDQAEAQVVVGPAPVVMTSGGTRYEDIVWDGSRWLAVRDGAVAISANGLAWTEHVVPGSFYPEGMVWTGEKYVAAGSQFIAVSEDGLAWSFTDMGAGAFSDVATCGGVTVAVGNSGRVLVSSDLVSWDVGASETTNDIRRVACGGGVFVATVNGLPSIIESTDGLSWTPAAADAGSSASALAWAEGTFFAASLNGGVWTRSLDGTWARVDDGLYSPSYLTDLAMVNGLLLASGDDSLWWLSPELSTWVPIEGSGNDRMAVADDTVMILNQKDIHSLAVQPLRLFSDGFESGDLSAWSATIQ